MHRFIISVQIITDSSYITASCPNILNFSRYRTELTDYIHYISKMWTSILWTNTNVQELKSSHSSLLSIFWHKFSTFSWLYEHREWERRARSLSRQQGDTDPEKLPICYLKKWKLSLSTRENSASLSTPYNSLAVKTQQGRRSTKKCQQKWKKQKVTRISGLFLEGKKKNNNRKVALVCEVVIKPVTKMWLLYTPNES